MARANKQQQQKKTTFRGHADLSGLRDKVPRSCSAEEHRYRDGSKSVVRHVQSGWSTGGSSKRPWNPVYIEMHEEGI